MKMASGDVENKMEYTTIDFNKKIDDSIFELDLPEDVIIENLDDIEAGFHDETITVNDIPKKMKQPALYIPDGKEHELDQVTYIEIEGEPSYKDVSVDYKKDGLPLMTLTIMASEEMGQEEVDVLELAGEQVRIRNEEGILMDLNGFRSVSWNEGGLRYTINIIDPKVTLDELKIWAEEMEEIK